MIDSRADYWRVRGGLVVLVAIGIGMVTPVSAQVGAPTQLAPPTPLTAPSDTAPSTDTTSPPTPNLLAPSLSITPDQSAPSMPADVAPRPGTSRATADGVIQIETLDRLMVDTAGTLSVTTGGLDSELWRGTPGDIAERLVRLLPAAPASHGLRDLARRFLLTSGPVPKDLTAPGALLAQRAERLLAMGALDELAALARVLPSGFMTPDLARVLAEHAFAVGDDATACALNDRLQGDSGDHFWIKVAVVCDYLAGNVAKVDFGSRLLAEVSAPDPLLIALAQAAIGGYPEDVIRLEGAGPVHVALARAATVPIDPDVASITSLPALVALSRGAAAPPFTARLTAAEKAERAGAIGAQGVTDLYAQVSLQVDTLDKALGIAEADPGPYARAILWRAAEAQTVPVARAQAIAKALEIAEDKAAWRQTSRLFGTLLATLQPGALLDWFTEDAVRALIAADNTAAAGLWIERLRRVAASGNPEARTMWRRLWPVTRIAGGDSLVRFDAAAVDGWWDWLKDVDRDAASGRAAVALGLMDGLGTPVGSGAWRGLAAAPSTERHATPGVAFVLGLRAAVADARLGETVALAVAGLGEVPLDALGPMAIVETVRALRAVGLEKDARRFAAEAALAQGL